MKVTIELVWLVFFVCSWIFTSICGGYACSRARDNSSWNVFVAMSAVFWTLSAILLFVAALEFGIRSWVMGWLPPGSDNLRVFTAYSLIIGSWAVIFIAAEVCLEMIGSALGKMAIRRPKRVDRASVFSDEDVQTRIRENRELLACLKAEAPDALENRSWIEDCLLRNEAFLVALSQGQPNGAAPNGGVR